MSHTETRGVEAEGGSGPAVKRRLWARLFAITATWVLLLDVLLVFVFGLMSQENVFWSGANLQALLLAGTQGFLLAIALCMLMGGGVIDLSLGANLVLSSVVGGLVIQAVAGPLDPSGASANVGMAMILGLLAAVATGMLFGLVNGLIISYLDVNALIATLGTMGIGMGVALVITNGGDITGLPTQLQTEIGLRTFFDVLPLPALVALSLGVLAALMFRFTRLGMRTLAMGSSKSAAERSGIGTRRLVIRLTMMAGALGGLAGFVDLARFGATTVAGHPEDALQAIAAVIIGGTLLEGGRVSLFGAFVGTVLAVVLRSGLVVIGVPPFYQLIVVGAVLVIAIAIDRHRFKRATR